MHEPEWTTFKRLGMTMRSNLIGRGFSETRISSCVADRLPIVPKPHTVLVGSLSESRSRSRADCPRVGVGVDSAEVGRWNLTRLFDEVPYEQVEAVALAPGAL